jgi:hypothetical protein
MLRSNGCPKDGGNFVAKAKNFARVIDEGCCAARATNIAKTATKLFLFLFIKFEISAAVEAVICSSGEGEGESEK